MKQSDTWCPEIYRSIYIDRVNHDKVRIAPCCQAQGSTVDIENLNFASDLFLTDLRTKFTAGQKPVACSRCWQAEELGQKSRRQSAIEFFNLDKSDTTVTLESIDHNVTWACNLACIMCNPNYSSTWANELKLNKSQLTTLGRSLIKSNGFLEKLNLHNLKKLHFNGGEPLLNDDHLTILEQLNDQQVLKDVFISYNTNGTVFPSQKVIELWKKTKLVKLFFSIDATEKAFEYVRWPAKWDQTQQNLLDMKNQLPGNVMFGFNITVGCYNIFELADVWKWFEHNMQTNREGDLSDFSMQFAYNFDLQNLKKQVVTDAIANLATIPQFNGIVAHLGLQINYKESSDWINELETIDSRRNTSWRDSLKIGKYYQ